MYAIRSYYVSALMIASVIGKVMEIVVPTPTSLSNSISPERREILFFTTSMPTPRPEMSLTLSAVEKPGINSRSSYNFV